MPGRRSTVLLAAATSVAVLVLARADWSTEARQDPAREVGLGPRGVEVFGTLVNRPRFGAAEMAVFIGIGVGMTVGGVAIGRGRRESSPGVLLAAAGLVYLLGGLRRATDPVLFTTGALITLFWVPVLIHATAIFPLGSVLRRWHRGFVATTYAFFVVSAIAEWAIFDPRQHVASGRSTALNLLLIHDEPVLFRQMQPFLGIGFIATGVLLLAMMADKWWSGSSLYRRAIAPMWGAGIIVVLSQMVGTLWISGQTAPPPAVYFSLRYWPTALISGALAAGVVRYRAAHAGISKLMVDIGEAPLNDVLAPALRRAVGDPSLKLLIWSPQAEGYEDDDGTIVDVVHSPVDRVTTFLETGGRPVGVIVHDAALVDQPELLAAIRGATTLALDNERLQTELQAQLVEVSESRARLVRVTDVERRRLERDIHDGAQQQLVAAAIHLKRAMRATSSDQATYLMHQGIEQLERATAELRELARGLQPPLLRERGLHAALRSLAERAPLPIDLDLGDPCRFPESFESCAYYVASEGITNASKHADATHVAVALVCTNSLFRMSLTDDGVGGAVPAPGGGLSGLRDRAAALGGHLSIRSPIGDGTVLEFTLPAKDERNRP